MRALLVVAVLLSALVVGADLVAVGVAERVIAGQAQRAAMLPERPQVDVQGFPFLTQALRGRYEHVRLRATGGLGVVEVDRLDVRLQGVRVPVSDVVGGRVDAIPVDRLRGEVVVTYAWLSEQAGKGLTLSAQGDLLRVRGEVRVLGQELAASALSEVRLVDGAVLVRAQELDTGAGPVDRFLESVLADRFDVRVPIEGLPYGLDLTGLQVRPEGLLLRASSGPTVLGP